MSDDSPTRVGHCKRDEYDEYAGRGRGGRHMLNTPVGERGWLGNPFSVDDYDRKESIEQFARAFADKLRHNDEFRCAVRELRGQVLGCWCQGIEDDAPACHAEVIAGYVDGERPQGWPEMLSEPAANCNHQFHWDDAEGLYRCLYDDTTKVVPPRV